MEIDLKYARLIFKKEKDKDNVYRYVISTKKLTSDISDYSISLTLHKKNKNSMNDCIDILDISSTNENTKYEVVEDEKIKLIKWDLSSLDESSFSTLIINVKFFGKSEFNITENVHEEFILNNLKKEYDFNAYVNYFDIENAEAANDIYRSDTENEVVHECFKEDSRLKEFNIDTEVLNSDGQIFSFNIRIKDVCPCKDLLVALIVEEIIDKCNRKIAAYRVMKLPPHTVKPSRDVTLKNVEVLLDDYDFNKKYAGRVIAQYK